MPTIRFPSRFILAFAVVLNAGVALAQNRTASSKSSEVDDSAHIFTADAVAKAKGDLERLSWETSVPVTIETIETLLGEPIADVAVRRARRSGREGLYVLVSKEDKKIEVMASPRFRDALPLATQRKIRDGFIEGLREADKDEGLRKGVGAIMKALADVKETGRIVKDVAAGRQLVVHDQVRLTLGGAQQVVDGAIKKAEELGLKMNIAVVDEGGHPLSFARMDGARPASAYTATTKAVSAATFRQPTSPVPPGTTAPDLLLNLSLPNAATASGGKITTLLGGLPIVVDGQVIGGVGVGGGSGEQDATVAKAGIESFLSALPNSKPASDDEPTRPTERRKTSDDRKE